MTADILTELVKGHPADLVNGPMRNLCLLLVGRSLAITDAELVYDLDARRKESAVDGRLWLVS